MRYRLPELAEQDLLELWLHVAADAGPERADGVIDVIVSRFELLAEHPELGRSRPEFGKADMAPEFLHDSVRITA